MEQHRLKRVPAATRGPRRDVWFRVTGNSEWIHLETLFGQRTISRAVWTPRLLRWSGLASIVGGVLWFTLIFVTHLSYVILENSDFLTATWRLVSMIYGSLDLDWLVVPLLLFLVGVVGLYVLQWTHSSRLAKWGLGLSVAGIVLAVMDTLFPFWLKVIHRYVAPGYSGLFDGWWPRPPFHVWFGEVWLDLIIMSVGLALLGIAVSRSRAMATTNLRSTAPGTFVLPAIFVLLVALFLLWPFVALTDSLDGVLDMLTIIALLFGVGWIWIGFKLVSRGTRPLTQPLPASSTA
jgi:hypothetical protein